MEVRIVPSEGPGPEEKLADCELVFADGLLAGMKLVGFSIWRGRRSVLPSVTFPSRTFQVNGERRSYALLRPESAAGTRAQEVLRATILQAYGEYESRPQPGGDVSQSVAAQTSASEEVSDAVSSGESSGEAGSVDDRQ